MLRCDLKKRSPVLSNFVPRCWKGQHIFFCIGIQCIIFNSVHVDYSVLVHRLEPFGSCESDMKTHEGVYCNDMDKPGNCVSV